MESPSSGKLMNFRRAKMILFRSHHSVAAWLRLSLLLLSVAAVAAQDLLGEIEPARVSCDAGYSTPCARTNAQWLAVKTANDITQQLATSTNTTATLDEAWESINNQSLNMDIDFYPFVFDKYTGLNVAHGVSRDLVGLSFGGIFDLVGIGFSRADAVLERVIEASESPKGGGWVRYLWSDILETEGQNITKPRSKMAYVVSVMDRFALGVGYENKESPTDLPCTADYDSWCSLTNVRSLVGKAQFLLNQAESLSQFEDAIYELSFNADEYQLPGGFYTFMYGYDGILKSHALFPDKLGKSFSQMMVEKNLSTAEEADMIHRNFILAAEGDNGGWIQYPWREKAGEPDYTKIAFIVKIEFEEEEYYLGTGFKFESQDGGLGPGEKPCTDKHNLPCAYETALQLSSHALTHAISSPLPTDEIWKAISEDPMFRRGDFYVYAYDFNMTCVAHGLKPEYAGMTLLEVYEQNNISLNANLLHNQFRTAAEAGGGWVLYDWLVPGVENSIFPKLAYLFQITLGSSTYYGGVGFNHQRAPLAYYADNGTRMDGVPVPCSHLYGMECSENNTHAILGQAIGDLTLASSEARVSRFTPTGKLQPKMEDVLRAITNRHAAFVVNDFYVSFFSVDGSECEVNDGSGCCLAHGSDPSMVGKTWQQILGMNEVTSIAGSALHSQLIFQSHTKGGYVDYPYSGETGEARMKHAVPSKYKNGGKEYYVVAEYFKTPQPPTCDSCPSGMECTRLTQSYCEEMPDSVILPSVVPWIVSIAVLMVISLACFYWYKRRNWKKRKMLSQKIEKMEDQLKNMVEIVDDIPLPCTCAEDYKGRFGQEGVEAAGSPYFEIDWGWEEDKELIAKHSPYEVMAGTNFVKYSDFISSEIEQAYRLWKSGEGAPRYRVDLTYRIEKAQNQEGGYCYVIDFQTMKQTNKLSRRTRGVRREELIVEIESDIVEKLPPLPAGVDFFSHNGEYFLPTFGGQVIQVSKEHPNKQWLYGSILYDPLLVDAQKNRESGTASQRKILSKALHDRPTSGWFPAVLSKAADAEVMQKIVDSLGEAGVGNLKKPDTWEVGKEGRIALSRGSIEYDRVVRSFLDTLQHHRQYVTVVNVERIQSFPLWQSYAVKKETMKKRDMQHPEHLIHNKDPDGLERQWLFHGTTSAILPKIIKQGFNRAFAGRNAVAFGKGVYFAR